MRHAVIKGVRPNWYSAKGSGDGGIVNEELISHHFKLFVASDTEERSTNTDDGTIRNVSKPFDNQSVTSHFSQPVIVSSLSPVLWVVSVGDGKDTNFMTTSVKLLDGRIVGVLVGDIERALEGTAIGILSFTIENLLEQINVVRVDGTVEGDGDHLRNLGRVNITGDPGTIGRTETVGQLTLAQIAVGSPVGILIYGASTLIRAIRTVKSFIAEEFFVNALAITALQLAIWTDGFVGL